MATLTKQVVANNDNGYIYPSTLDKTEGWCGWDGDVLNNAFARFTGITIPKDATIISAYIQYRASASTGLANFLSSLYMNKVANAVSPTTYAEYNALALSTAVVNWDKPVAWKAGTWYNSPDITALIQEIVNQPSWVSGNAMTVLHKNRKTSGSEADIVYDLYAQGSAYAPKLVITYSIDNNRNITVEMANVSSVSASFEKSESMIVQLVNVNSISVTLKKQTMEIAGTSKYITVYDQNETNFKHNGLCVLNECISAPLIESLNGGYELELEYPLDERGKYLNLVEDNIIKADGQLCRIYRKIRTEGGIKINARHIFYDLIDNFLEDVTVSMLNGAGSLSWILSHTQYAHNFRAVSDVPKAGTWNFKAKNPVEAIMGTGGIIETIGGELELDNFTINLHQKRGADRGVLVAYGKNITGIEETLDTSGIVTRILPTGKDGLMLPSKYVDSPYIGNYPHPKVFPVEFGDIDNTTDLSIAANDYILNSGCDIPQFNYKIDFVELTKTEEYKHYAILERVYLGDTVTIKHRKLGLNLKAKVIKTTKNLITGRLEGIELGSFKPNISSLAKDIQFIKDNVINIQTAFQTAVDNATKLIMGGDGGNLIIKKDANGKPVGLLIMDTDNPLTAQNVWQFNMGGLGHSSTGINGPYTTAITQDGSIVATFITGGILNASLLQTGSIVSQDGSISISLVTGVFTIGGDTGDVAKHTNAYSKWMHGSNGNYSQADSSGFFKHVGSSNRDYHYLCETGEALTSGENSAFTVTLDPAFKGKEFKVIVSVMDSENPSPYIGETMVSFTCYVDDESYDYVNGKVKIYGWGTWYDVRQVIGDQINNTPQNRSYTSELRLAWTAIA